MVALGQAIGAGIQQLSRDVGSEAEASRRILQVHDREVDLVPATERGKQVADGLPARLADHVSNE